MLNKFKRHPFAVVAHFRDVLVLTYACPAEVLVPLVAPGLTLDEHEVNGQRLGFVAVAMVDVERLHPVGLPAMLGQRFFLAGYRIFVRRRMSDGRARRGLQILQSHTDHRRMVVLGNFFTHYQYQRVAVQLERGDNRLAVSVHPLDRRDEPELQVTARLDEAALPAGSPFADERIARRFAGPMPWTFNYEPQTHSIIAVKGEREGWEPRLVSVEVSHNRFLERPPFDATRPVLASAFHVGGVDYRWQRGICQRLAVDWTPRSRSKAKR